MLVLASFAWKLIFGIFSTVATFSFLIIFLKSSLLLSLGACSHARAWEYYHESIVVSTEAENFISKGCASWDEYEGQNCIEENLIPMGESLTLEELVFFVI